MSLPRYPDRLNERGRITVKKYLREALGHKKGEYLAVWVQAYPSVEDCRGLIIKPAHGSVRDEASVVYDWLDNKGRFTVPEKFREALGFKEGMISPIMVAAYPSLDNLEAVTLTRL
jgi:bifunctional DNA-binding transcriptional regulator/antitoxin component of YhaV-PrlF toxin-antitoxin module